LGSNDRPKVVRQWHMLHHLVCKHSLCLSLLLAGSYNIAGAHELVKFKCLDVFKAFWSASACYSMAYGCAEEAIKNICRAFWGSRMWQRLQEIFTSGSVSIDEMVTHIHLATACNTICC
jgi:hypothetical protein